MFRDAVPVLTICLPLSPRGIGGKERTGYLEHMEKRTHIGVINRLRLCCLCGHGWGAGSIIYRGFFRAHFAQRDSILFPAVQQQTDISPSDNRGVPLT